MNTLHTDNSDGSDSDTPPITAEGAVNLFALMVWLTAVVTVVFVVGAGLAVWPVLVGVW